MRSNQVSRLSPLGRYLVPAVTLEAEMAAFDGLPSGLRELLRDAPFNVCAAATRENVTRFGEVPVMVDYLQGFERLLCIAEVELTSGRLLAGGAPANMPAAVPQAGAGERSGVGTVSGCPDGPRASGGAVAGEHGGSGT